MKSLYFFKTKNFLETVSVIVLLGLVLFSCGSKNQIAMKEEAAEMPYEATEFGANDFASARASQEKTVVEQKLIKRGDIEFETDDLVATRKNILQATKKSQGYVTSDREFTSESQKNNTLVVRIPAKNFDSFLATVTKEVQRFDRKSITVEDVTEEFLDVQARLKTKKELEQRYLVLLKQAKNMKEMLAIEKEMAKLRGEIESVEGRLKYLQNQVSFSTVTITFYKMVSAPIGFGKKFIMGFKNGWHNFIWFFVFVTNIWPFIFIAGFLIFVIIRRKRNQLENQAKGF